MESEKIIIEAPMSYTGSAKRLWRLNAYIRIPLIILAWIVITGWYLFFGLWIVPYRLIRRSQRKQKQAALRHRELTK